MEAKIMPDKPCLLLTKKQC